MAYDNDSAETKLNNLGKDGWVLAGYSYVSIKQTGANNEHHLILKRLKD